ncbi:hypothetical protein HAPS_0666 [Glaesserella parasuis SH0165]|uniref:Uncharacterized protein n=1 Tax=Glaesserella parasuis serovar 5 (strain SH0165) TaxID=557723 RepID=B8F4R2_GLAP5|nr:hypothetical protein HAPS_0666 [Glaesserella parasuis SH0165]
MRNFAKFLFNCIYAQIKNGIIYGVIPPKLNLFSIQAV